MNSQNNQGQWKDSDRINLLKVYQEHSQWNDQLEAMQELFPDLEETHFFFQKMNCDLEFKRIMSGPCPTHKVVFPPPKYSRKDAIQNWIDFYKIQVEKQRKLDFQLALVEVRSNLKMMNSVLKKDVKDEEIEQVMTMIETNPNREMTEEKKVKIEVLAEAIHKILEENPVNQIPSDIPATKPPPIGIDPNSSTELKEAIKMIYSALGSKTALQPTVEDVKENEAILTASIEEQEEPQEYTSKLRKRVRDSTQNAMEKIEKGKNSETGNIPLKKSRGNKK
ncbi:unnamed protein product [Caenorhabditis brenneri]